MMKTLIKKQLFESWRGVFINSKTGKVRTKGSMIGMIILFFFCFISLGFSFFGMSMVLTPLFNTEYEWLIYAIFGIMAISACVLLNAFSASSILYKAKDNDLLLSMPIKAKDILFSRMVGLYSTATLYSACVWLPVCLNGWIHGVNSMTAIIFDVLLTFIMGLIVTALSCVVGYIFSFITNISKNKSLVTILASIALLIVYYFTMFRIEEIFNSFVTNSDSVANSISSWGLLFVCLAKGAQGDALSFIVFLLISLLVFALIYFVLSKSFISIATKNNNVSKKSGKIVYSSKGNIKSALFKKELLRFTGSPAYFLNTGMGILFALGLSILAVIKLDDINATLIPMKEAIPMISSFIPIIILLTVIFIASMDCISAPSFSLEGNSLWILKSLPIDPYNIFAAKELLHLVVSGIPSLIAAVILGLCFKLEINCIIFICVIVVLFIQSQAIFGLIVGILRPNFHWTNETQPIKQSLNMLFVMIYGWIIALAIGGVYYLLMNKIDLNSYLEVVIIAFCVITVLFRKWIRTKGVKAYNNL